MMRSLRRLPAPLLAALGVVGLSLVGLLAGFEPIGGDPDLMYRPIKAELARALRAGGLPFWSDRFGLGTPLAAESHVAAFYPPNWLIFRALGVGAAYRLSMWLHFVATAGTTFFYARTLGLTDWGSSLAAIAFALSGFSAGHSCHEPFYHILPYLPLSLTLTERFLRDGGASCLAALALAVGVPFTLGHFQIQTWTVGLVLLTGVWRAWGRETTWKRVSGLVAAIAWAGGIASLQLGLTSELTRFAQFDRPLKYMTVYACPPAHWAQLALPRLFMVDRGEGRSPYWEERHSSAEEASLYLGAVALVLAGPGLLAPGRRALSFWRGLALLGFLLATMPLWWLDGYYGVLLIPGMNLFRCPGRYTLLTLLGLSLLAGRGFDRGLSRGRFWAGYALAAAFGVSAIGWGVIWSSRPEIVSYLGEGLRRALLLEGAAALGLALLVVAAWRVGRVSPWCPILLTSVELAVLFFHGTTRWGRPIEWTKDSPVIRQLVREPGVGLVAGWLRNLPVRLGLTTADPYLGITAPPPNYLLDAAVHPESSTFRYREVVRRFGVTHGVFDDRTQFLPSDILYVGQDPLLDALLPRMPGTPRGRVWRVERYGAVGPEARAAVRVRTVKDWYEMLPILTDPLNPEVVCFLRQDVPPDPPGPRARSARVVQWEGFSGVVEHDGTCDLVVRHTYYPGWSARIDGGRNVPVVPADGGLQSIRLPGSGRTRVSLHYRPTRFPLLLSVSVGAACAAVSVLVVSSVRRARRAGG